MTYDVLLRKTENKYIAQVKDLPLVIAEENTREEAIKQVKKNLSEYLNSLVEIIQIQVPLPDKYINVWLDKFGCFKNDPTFDDLQKELATYRLEIEQLAHHGT